MVIPLITVVSELLSSFNAGAFTELEAKRHNYDTATGTANFLTFWLYYQQSTMPPNKPQLTLFVDFYIYPHLIEQWKTAHRPVWDACANEPECLLFDVFEDPEDVGHFRLVEVWNATREWFETEQLTKPYYATLWEGSKPTWRKECRIEYLERLGEGCSYRKGYVEGGKCMD
ncbi:hypothetical protein LTR09_001334 [Extremus antarcticus]|uniref:Uncharacterized protein n=1 Tax=Extremus antarcticus TaxID=702011 RepID=A0AAJ0GIK3_9PEZI|nr:hypothetical protein LTR09_001334 [Extremus antarcticus]